MPPAARQEGFRSVLLAALNTRYYAEVLRSARLGTEEAIAEAGSLEEVLARLPRMEPGLVRTDSRALVNPAAPAGQRRELFWPLPPASRTAVLSALVATRDGLRIFRGDDTQGLARWRPDALAGPVGVLRRLAEEGGLPQPLRHSVIAFVTLRRAFLTEAVRELFWSTWEVPVFGQIFGLSRELLAWECEAHAGYHFDPHRVVFEVDPQGAEPELLVTSLDGLRRPAIRLATCLTGWLDPRTCGCGRSGPRLVDVRPRSQARMAAAAAAGAGPRLGVLT